jgi:hypothetical protein
LRTVEHVPHLVEVFLILDLVGVGLAKEWVVEDLEMLFPLLRR